MRLGLGPALVALALLLVAVGAEAPSAAGRPPRAAWTYDLPDLDGPALARALDRLVARGVTRLFLSVEDGPRFRLDGDDGRSRVARVVEAASRRGLAVEAMLLQDPRWLDDRAEARRRAAVAAAFRLRADARAFEGLHLDPEPHTLDAWECGGEAGRAALVRRLADLAAEVRAAAQGLPVSVAVPWWSLGERAPGGVEAARRLAASVDGVVLMAYGEPGGPLVTTDGHHLLCRLRLPEALGDLPAGTRLAVGLAGYEFPDAAALDRAAAVLDGRLAASPRYAGTALFLERAPPGTPLVVSIRGRVLDPAGRPAPRAVITVRGGRTAHATTNACGRFVVRLASPGAATLVAEAAGVGRAEMAIVGLVAGREREVGTLVLGAGAAGEPHGPSGDPALPPFADGLARARALGGARDYAGAEALYRALLDRWPRLLDARLGLARLDAWRGRHEAAAAAFRAILADRCDAAEAHLGLADLERWAGRLAAAADHYRAVADGWPHEPAGTLGLARVALDAGRPGEALALVDRALALDPSNAEAHSVRARARREAGR